MRNLISLARLGALLFPLALFGAENPATAATHPAAVGRVELSQGVIGPEGGTLVSPDGTVEVAWDPNPQRAPTPSSVWTLVATGGGGGLSFQIKGAPGPATISCFPPGETAPGATGDSGPGPGPVKPPEPVIEIQEGNGEWREVEAPRQANGARKVRIDDDLEPIDTKVTAIRLFKLVPSRAILALGEKITFELRPNAPPPPPAASGAGEDDDEERALPPSKKASSDVEDDEALAPLPSKKAASGSSAKAASSKASAANRAIDQALGEAPRRKEENKPVTERWLVFGVPWGNPTYGTIEQTYYSSRNRVISDTIEYTAPKTLPAELLRRENNTVMIYAKVRRGQRVESYHAPVRLLDEGEVAVDITCTLTYANKVRRFGPNADGFEVVDSEDFSESLVVEGSFVLKMRESKKGDSIWIRDAKREPIKLSYQAKLSRTTSHANEGPGEYGKRGETLTESAESSGTEVMPVPDFIYYSKEKKWEADIPMASWLRTATARSGGETHQTFFPKGTKDPLHFAKLANGWAIANLPFDLQNFSTSSAEAEKEWTGVIEQRVDRFHYHVKWKVRR